MELPRLKIGIDWENKMPVYITDRYTHILLMGKSGTGKSTSISNWWEQDHYYKSAKVLVDPSSFLARDCYSISGGIYCSLEHNVSLNPMIANYSDAQICDIIIESMNQMITQTSANTIFTVKMVDLLVIAIKWCIGKNRRSLLHVLDYVKNMSGNAETRDGIIARLQFLLNDEKMVKLLCGNNSIEWGDLIAKKQTLIVDCSAMSREKMIFAGSLVTNGIKNYFRYSRPKEYLPVSVFIDECQNFLSPSVGDILKEARKYNVSFCLATQDFAVIREQMTRLLLNIGNIVSYRLGHREAAFVAGELDCTPQELQFIEKYHVMYLTPKARGIAKAPHPPFIVPKIPVAAPEPVAGFQRKSKPTWFTTESYQTT